MFKFLRNLVLRLRGMFIMEAEDLVASSPEAIGATYTSAIDDAKTRYKQFRKSFARLILQRETVVSQVRDLDNKARDLSLQLEGVIAKAKKEPDNQEHKKAGAHFIDELNKLKPINDRLKNTLLYYDNLLKKNRVQLTSKQEEIDNLAREKDAAIVEFMSAQHTIEMEEALKGLSDNPHASAITVIRNKINTMKVEANLLAEEATPIQTYLEEGKEIESSRVFEELLEKNEDEPLHTFLLRKERLLG